MQPFRLNEKTWRKGKELKPLGTRSYVVESNGQLYSRYRRHLKRSAEVDSAPAEEWPTSSNHHDSKVRDHLANEQSTLKPVAMIVFRHQSFFFFNHIVSRFLDHTDHHTQSAIDILKHSEGHVQLQINNLSHSDRHFRSPINKLNHSDRFLDHQS